MRQPTTEETLEVNRLRVAYLDAAIGEANAHCNLTEAATADNATARYQILRIRAIDAQQKWEAFLEYATKVYDFDAIRYVLESNNETEGSN